MCPDHVLVNEDMAYKGHSMISPDMTMKVPYALLPEMDTETEEKRLPCY
jgi:hypothetical protein